MVKSLAAQTGRARGESGAIQAAAGAAVAEINKVASAIAAAVEQQGTATR